MGGLSRRSLFAGLFTAPVAIAAGMPLGMWERFRTYCVGFSGIVPVVNMTVENTGESAYAAHKRQYPFGAYKTARGQTIGRARHAALNHELMQEYGLPEFRDLSAWSRNVLEQGRVCTCSRPNSPTASVSHGDGGEQESY